MTRPCRSVPVLFTSLPFSSTHTFTSLSHSTQLLALKPPPNSHHTASDPSYYYSASGYLPRQTTDFIPASNGLGSLVVTLTGREAKKGLVWWNHLGKAVSGGRGAVGVGKITTVKVGKCGTYLAVGTDEGRVMMWDLGSGTLLASFDAHYRAITALAFTPEDAALVTASSDAQAAIWSTTALIDHSSLPSSTMESPQPWARLVDHTLAVTDVVVGNGVFPDVRVVTASLDGSVKIWAALYPQKPLLATFLISGPAHHVALDPLERALYVSHVSPSSTSTSSSSAASHQPVSGHSTFASASTASTTQASTRTLTSIPLFLPPSQSALSAPPGHAHPPSLTPSYTTPPQTLITALHLPSPLVASGQILLGLSNGRVVHLSLPGLQVLRTTTPAGPTVTDTGPVTFLATCLRPADLVSTWAPGRGEGEEDVPLPRPVGALARTVGTSGESSKAGGGSADVKERVAWMRLPHPRRGVVVGDYRPEIVRAVQDSWLSSSSSSAYAKSWSSGSSDFDNHFPNSAGVGDGYLGGADETTRLREEVAQLKEQLGEAVGLNEAMWKAVVEGSLKLDFNAEGKAESRGKKRKVGGGGVNVDVESGLVA